MTVRQRYLTAGALMLVSGVPILQFAIDRDALMIAAIGGGLIGNGIAIFINLCIHTKGNQYGNTSA